MDAVFLYPSASAQLVMEKRMEAITNNIANVDTTGFKRDTPIFAARVANLSKAHSLGGASDPTGGMSLLPVPVYPVVDEVVTDFAQGIMKGTDNPLDIAIEGKGFFQIQTPNGIQYTRNGSFELSAQGQIVTKDGGQVLGEGGAITLPPGMITIDNEGGISVLGDDGKQTKIDNLVLVTIDDLTKMKKLGDNLFQLVEGATATPFPEGRIHQGMLEGSNVNPVVEMVSMISAYRHYEMVQKAIQGADDIAQSNANKVGQLRA